MAVVWSCGGGTQSAAIAALIVRGDLPKPDAAVIADTGREASQTWRYFDGVLRPELAKVGVDLIRLPHSSDGTGWNTVDRWGGEDGKTMLVPMYTTHNGGPTLSQTAKFCSNEWKARPVERYYRSLGLTGGRIWIGFTIDELHRMRSFDPRAKWNHEYPLVERRMDRGDCVAVVHRMGWPTPPRSSCWMCPYRTKEEWQHLKATDPGDFLMAIEFEQEAQAVDPTLYLHRSGVSLGSVNFDDAQADLLGDQCSSGLCFT
jgi:hypothetical protein